MVSSVEDLYDVGAFVQITEVHDMGDKMRMIIQGHRRWALQYSTTPPGPQHLHTCYVRMYCTYVRMYVYTYVECNIPVPVPAR